MPGYSGTFEVDKQPVAITQNFADARPPLSVTIFHRFELSSKIAEVTRVSN